MKKSLFFIFTLICLFSCKNTSQLVVKNDTDTSLDMFLKAYEKRFGSKYTLSPNTQMIIGENKNDKFDYITAPYMFVRTKDLVKDSIIYINGKKSGSLTITSLDTLKIDSHILDSLFKAELLDMSKKRPKQIVLSIQNSLFEKGSVGNRQGFHLNSKIIVNQKPYID